MHTKNFELWNTEKKTLHFRTTWPERVFARQIWWCCIGINIGAEVDGKNEKFERPVLILKHINREMVLIAPLTRSLVKNKFCPCVETGKTYSTVVLTQSRVISKKRLTRLVDYLRKNEYSKVISLFVEFINGL